ncbi:MAG: putative transcriptional regulator, GntR family [Solirubrobacterales bacterium]|nr:putative transcriptional regulator, GntR family [Solirubrobacterales bacterium]
MVPKDTRVDRIARRDAPLEVVRAPRSQLRDEAASYIRSLILSRQLAPGDYVRPEPLARALDMSVTPIREALLSLREQGFLELRPNRGFAVLKISPADVADLFLVQAFAAGELAARAATRMDAETLRRLDTLNSELDVPADERNPRAFEVANDRFHASINRSSGSPRLAWFYAEAIPIIPRRFLTLVPGWIETTQKDHRLVATRLRERDVEGSRSAMAAHIRNVGELVADRLDAGGAWPPAREEDLRGQMY